MPKVQSACPAWQNSKPTFRIDWWSLGGPHVCENCLKEGLLFLSPSWLFSSGNAIPGMANIRSITKVTSKIQRIPGNLNGLRRTTIHSLYRYYWNCLPKLAKGRSSCNLAYYAGRHFPAHLSSCLSWSCLSWLFQRCAERWGRFSKPFSKSWLKRWDFAKGLRRKRTSFSENDVWWITDHHAFS